MLINNRYTYDYLRKLYRPAVFMIVALFALFVMEDGSVAKAASPTEFPTSGTALRNARLRTGPSTSYASVGTLRGGTTVQLTSCNTNCDWYKLSNGRWVAGFLVRLHGSSSANSGNAVNTNRPTSRPMLYQVMIRQDANLRAGPGISSSVVGTIQRGRTVNVSNQSSGGRWLQLDNGVWIAASLTAPAGRATVVPAADLAKPVSTTSSTTSSTAPCACDRDRYNCRNFASAEKAQKCANYCASQNLGDIHNMDLNQNGLVCENMTWPNIPTPTVQMPTRQPTVPLPIATPVPTASPVVRATPTPMPREPIASFGGPVSSEASASASILSCSCSADVYDCSDFISQSSAQSCFWYCGSVGVGDIHKLDLDNDRVVCEGMD